MSGAVVARIPLSRRWSGSLFLAYLATLVDTLAWRLAPMLALTVGITLTEGIGLLLLVPLLRLTGIEVSEGVGGSLDGLVAAPLALFGGRPTLAAVLALFLAAAGARALLARAQTTATLALQVQFVADRRQRLYQAIADSNWLFFTRRRGSDFVHVLTHEIDRVGMATHELFFAIGNVIAASLYIAAALQLSPAMTALVLGLGGGLMTALRGKNRAASRIGEALSATSSRLYSAAAEHVAGVKTAKSCGAEARDAAHFARLSRQVAQSQVEAVRTWADARCWFEVGSALVLCLVVYTAIAGLGLSGGGLLLLLFLFARLVPCLSGLQQSYQYILTHLPAFAAVREMEAQCRAAREPPAPTGEAIRARSCVRFERVTFAYGVDGSAPAIADLSLDIKVGQTTAIVGPSGAGKSTVADLALALIWPDSGRILVDGQALTPERARAWRRGIGYVPQDTFLLHDTIRANLRWACPEASDDELWRALRLAAAEEFVAALPAGLATVVGDRGVRLSGGERQRLALARALLCRPSLLILDEATSSLDSENEQRIAEAVGRLHGQVTTLVIAHRLATVRGADAIYVLDGGRLVEWGTWRSLIASPAGRFRLLCAAQGLIDDGSR